LVYNFVELAGI